MSTEYKGIFVDDCKADLDIYSSLISELESKNYKLEIEGMELGEITKISTNILKLSPDLVLLDFRLDEDLSSNNLNIDQSYRGGALAQLLREKAIANNTSVDFPIVLLSAEDNIDKLYHPDKTSHDLFDCCYSKEDVAKEACLSKVKIFDKLIALIEGYRVLNTKRTQDEDILSIFSIECSDIKEIVEQQDIYLPLVSAGASHIAAQFILKYILRREGILCSSREVSAKLGINEDQFNESVTQWLEDKNCKYKDIFSFGWKRWWAHRVEEAIEEAVGSRAFNMTAEERVEKLNQEVNLNLTPAKSSWTNQTNEKLLFACCLCRQPTEVKHSLSVYDPNIPKFVQKKRICWTCIRDDRYKGKIEVDELEKRFIPNILAT